MSKKINWKSIVGWVVAIAVIFGIIGYNAYQAKQENATGKPNVLVLAHTTGAGAASDALKKALDRFREQNPNLSFNWISVDTQAMPSVAVTALHQQLALHDIDLVIAFIDSVVDAILPITNEKNIFTLGMFTEVQNVATKNGMENFQYFSTITSDIFTPMGRFLKQKASKIAVLYTDDAYGVGGFKVLKDEYLDGKNQIVFSDSYALQEYKLRDLVQKALYHKPDGIAVIGYGPGYENIFRLLKQYKYDGFVVADTVTARVDTYNRLDGALEGVYLPFATIYDKEKFEKTNLNSYADCIVFDALTYVDDAFRKGIPFTQDEFRKLKKYKNITTVNFHEDGRSNQDMAMGVWKNGKIVPVE